MERLSGDQFFVRDHVVQDHEANRLAFASDPFASAPVISAISFAAEDHPASSKALEQLTTIVLPDLVLGKRHYNRILYGRLCVTPFKLSAIATVLEDPVGRVVRVVIYNAVPSSASQQDVAMRFPVNMYVAIKEPYFKLGMDGRSAVRVDHPRDIVPVQGYPDADSSEANISKLADTLEEIRAEGNQLFVQGDWMGAVSKYTACIDQAKGIHIPMSQDCQVKLLLAYSNGAEARLRLQAFKDALSDSIKALELNPKHVKTMVRKASAEHALGLFEMAKKTFSHALALAPKQDRSSILKRLKDSETAFLQCQSG